MEKQFIKKIEAQLLEEKKNLEEELKNFADKDKKTAGDYDTRFPSYGEEEDINAQEVSTYDNSLPVEYTLETTLQKVKAALERIKNGTYGKCKKCVKEISKERLEAYPVAELCIKCKKGNRS